MYETVNAVMLETALANPVYVIVKLNDETPKAHYEKTLLNIAFLDRVITIVLHTSICTERYTPSSTWIYVCNQQHKKKPDLHAFVTEKKTCTSKSCNSQKYNWNTHLRRSPTPSTSFLNIGKNLCL